MKKERTAAFTLIELLVVIAIIGILASILIPTLGRAKVQGQITKARTEIANLQGAINQYHSTYGRYPATNRARTQGVTVALPDFTYGTTDAGPAGNLNSHVNKKGQVTTISSGGGAFQANNSWLMAILMDRPGFTNAPAGASGNPENSQHQEFYSPKSGDKSRGGLDPFGVLRDPWGAPYIITVDLNYDGRARDTFYRLTSVSEQSANGQGHYGLARAPAAAGQPADGVYELRGEVMVWSLGPDGYADPSTKANDKAGGNFDNVLSWK